MPIRHDSLHAQIADAERAIWSGDDRRSQLKAAFVQTAKRRIQASTSTWLIGGLAVAGVAWLLYPKRRAVMGLAGAALSHPIGAALLGRIPMAGLFMPYLTQVLRRGSGPA